MKSIDAFYVDDVILDRRLEHRPVDRVVVAVVHTVDTYVVDGHTCDGRVQWRQFVANHVGVDYVGLIHLQRRD